MIDEYVDDGNKKTMLDGDGILKMYGHDRSTCVGGMRVMKARGLRGGPDACVGGCRDDRGAS